MAKKRWQPYHFVVPLTEGEVPMDKGGFRTSGYSALEAVVYCKDCKHYDGEGTCLKIGIAMLDDDWFCADGEKEESETDD